MQQHHDASLRICHERIGDDPHKKPKFAKWAWCDLAAYAWCFDHDMYVCDIHYSANHEQDHVQLVSGEAGPSGN